MRTSLEGQRLRLHFHCRGAGSSPVGGLKIQHALWCGQNTAPQNEKNTMSPRTKALLIKKLIEKGIIAKVENDKYKLVNKKKYHIYSILNY